MLPFVVALSLSAAAEPLDLAQVGDGSSLPARVWRDDPSLQPVRTRVAQLEAERQKAYLLPNPGLDVGLNTIPVGPLNPPELKDPLLNVPNVAVGLSWLVEVGKRQPRQEARAEDARAAALAALEQLRQRVLDLEDTLGAAAAAQLRVESLAAQVEDARRLAELQKARAGAGDASGLDADRALLEVEGTSAALGEARAQLTLALRACSDIVAAPCLPFGSAAAAGAWLDRAIVEPEGLDVERRPDLRALESAVRSAQASRRLADATRLPDPTVRFGYVRDQFVISGNQNNSLFVGVSLPLPTFNRGKEDAAAAQAAALAAENERALRLQSARAQLASISEELSAANARLGRLRAESLPLARNVVARLDAAVSRGAAPMPELLLARRTLSELLLTEADLSRALFSLRLSRARLAGALEAFPESTP